MLTYIATCYLLAFAHAAPLVIAGGLCALTFIGALRFTATPSHADLRKRSRDANLALLRGECSQAYARAIHLEARNAGAYACNCGELGCHLCDARMPSPDCFAEPISLAQQPALCRAIHGEHASGVLCACGDYCHRYYNDPHDCAAYRYPDLPLGDTRERAHSAACFHSGDYRVPLRDGYTAI